MLQSHHCPWARRGSSSERRLAHTTITSGLALALLVGSASVAGCAGAHDDSAAESTGHSVAALSSTDYLYAIAGSQLEQGTVGDTFTPAGDAFGVTAIAGFHGKILVASANQLWQRGAIGPATGNDWSNVGSADGAVAMTYHQGQLYMVAHDHLWQRPSVDPGGGWTVAGDAFGVTAMASSGGKLYVTSGTKLWQRGAIGPATGNDWSEAGDAYGVTAMATLGDRLYVVSNHQLWKRGAIGPGTGNDWSLAGPAPSITALTSLPIDCSAGFSALDCPSSTVDLSGLVDVAAGRAVTTTSAWISVDLTFDRTVEAIALTADNPATLVLLDDASGHEVDYPLSAFTSANGMYILRIPPVTVRTVYVQAAGAPLHVGRLQAFARLVPSSLYPLDQHMSGNGACWKHTYGRGAGAPISACDANQDHDGALCYPQCSAGYHGVGPVCWQSCPSGWTDTGAFCHRDGSIISADNSSCPWYDACGLTLARGCSACPAGYANDGCTCRIDPQDFAKATYGRGAGVPLHCAAGQQEQAGLCYTSCASGYDGAGPVCWGQCGGDDAVSCGGAACASSQSACTAFIEDAVDSTIALALNVTSLVVTWGGATPITYTIETNIEQAAVQALTQYIAKRLVDASRAQDDPGAGQGGGVISDAVANTTAGAIVTGIQTGHMDWTALDPTGVAAVVLAFNQPICN